MSNLWGLSAEQILGRPTLHVPLNLIVQDMGEGKVTGVFQTSAGLPLLHGSRKTHQLILGDAFIRPQLVFESDAFRGSGLASLAMSGFIEHEKWIGGLLFERQ